MNEEYLSEILWDEDDLEDLIYAIKDKAHKAWNNGYTPHIEIEIAFKEDEE